jgi:hypothetical protein
MERSQSSFDFSRRTALKAGSAAALAALLDGLAWIRKRPALAATELPDIQFDIGGFIQPATSVDGVQVQFGPAHTKFMSGNLKRLPTKAEQTAFAAALDTLESVYEFSPAGVIRTSSCGPAGAATCRSSISPPSYRPPTSSTRCGANQAAQNLQTQFAVNPLDNGLERFLTSTRRQNFLCPPRRNRAFPLLELT